MTSFFSAVVSCTYHRSCFNIVYLNYFCTIFGDQIDRVSLQHISLTRPTHVKIDSHFMFCTLIVFEYGLMMLMFLIGLRLRDGGVG